MNLHRSVNALDLPTNGEIGDVLTRTGPNTVGFAPLPAPPEVPPPQSSVGEDGSALYDDGGFEAERPATQLIPWTFNGVAGFIPFIPAPVAAEKVDEQQGEEQQGEESAKAGE
jgi:hypothetical protein